MDKKLTFQEFMILAEEHYNTGGRIYCQLWDEEYFNIFVEHNGPITKEKALNAFSLASRVWGDKTFT